MSDELKKLREISIQTSEQQQSGFIRGSKKRYFLRNLELIFELTDVHGIKYREILEAMSREGFEFNYDYFRRLMAAAKKKTRKITPEEQANTSSPVTGKLITETAPKKDELSPEQKAYAAEIRRIKSLNIDSEEKKEMLMAAAKTYLKSLIPPNKK